MIKYNGRIELDRELTYTQAQQLSQFFIACHQKCLEISNDGRAIQWNKIQATDLQYIIFDIIEKFIKPWKINASGVIEVICDKKIRYEIIVLKNRVKIHRDGNISDVKLK